MVWLLILWLKFMSACCTTQEPTLPINPFEGYRFQVKQTDQQATPINYAPVDSEEDSEDSDDDLTDSAYVDKVNLEALIPHFTQNPLHIYRYEDRLSQAHICPILTPPRYTYK
jgi:hypothetical protein